MISYYFSHEQLRSSLWSCFSDSLFHSNGGNFLQFVTLMIYYYKLSPLDVVR